MSSQSQYVFRVDPEDKARLAALAQAMTTQREQEPPELGVATRISESDLLREALRRLLAEEEPKYGLAKR
jgi:hypothetical protein